MEVWFEVNKKDVIALSEKRKDRLPWGNHPDEKYRCLVFWEDGIIRLTVDEFYELDSKTFECCRYYTGILCNTIEDYKNMSEDRFISSAYNIWCSGAR